MKKQTQKEERKNFQIKGLVWLTAYMAAAITLMLACGGCQVQKQTASTSVAKTSATQSETWIGSFAGADCLEDFIDDLDPQGAANYECKAFTVPSKKSFLCVPTKLSTASYDAEVAAGQKLLDATYGWFTYIAGSGGEVTARRVQWANSGYPGYTGLVLSVLDYPKMDMKICSSRWNNVK